MCSYFARKMQMVKVSGGISDWRLLPKGTPQGSILGPFIFSVFINHLVFELQNVCDIYNHADDNRAVG